MDKKKLMDKKRKHFKIMRFIFNALENGWEIKKNDTYSYIFKKPHDNKEEVYSEQYLINFIVKNLELNK